MLNFVKTILKEAWANAENLFHLLGALAIIVGGVWTWMMFRVLHQKARAETELAKLQAESSELRVALDLDASSLETGNPREYTVSVAVTLTNLGAKAAAIPLEKESEVVLSRLDFDGNGTEIIGDQHVTELYFDLKGHHDPAQGVFAMPGEKRQWASAIRVKEPGLYLASIMLFRPPGQQKIAKKEGMPAYERTTWYASRLVVVGSPFLRKKDPARLPAKRSTRSGRSVCRCRDQTKAS